MAPSGHTRRLKVDLSTDSEASVSSPAENFPVADITSIAAGGDGVGRIDGMAVFVPRAAVGDELSLRIRHKRKRFAQADIHSILSPSSNRVTPTCIHYVKDCCGGCQLQHIEYGAQLTAKQNIISDAVRRIGKREIELPVIEASPKEWRYRTKLTLEMRRMSNSGRWIGGLHPYDAPDKIFNLTDCPITNEEVMVAWHEALAAGDCFPNTRRLRGSVRLTDEGAVFTLYGSHEWTEFAAKAFMEACPTIVALYWQPEDADRVLVVDRRSTASPDASFTQVNPEVAVNLTDYIESLILATGSASSSPSIRTVTEGYAGNGDLAVRLSAHGLSVRAIELDKDAAAWSKERLSYPSASIQGRVEDKLGSCLPSDIVILNPPRGGLHDNVPVILERHSSEIKKFIYISCDPATFARDLSRLPSFGVKSSRAFDMFPQTAHVETVWELVPSLTI